MDLYAERPVFGWGSGSYRRAYRRETGTSDVRAVAASHTIPLTVAAEQGTIGLALYLGLLITSLLALLRAARRGLASAAIAAAYVAMVLHSWFYAAFLEDPLTWRCSPSASRGCCSAPRWCVDGAARAGACAETA